MFIVFEGIDGSGKTTVSNQLARVLKDRGLRVKHLRAEGKFASSVTEAIRTLGRDARNWDLVPEAEFLLYVARDVQLMQEATRPALETHDVVIADRFLYTAEVLGRFGRGLPKDWTTPILAASAGGLWPDLTILVDVDPALARARRKAHKIAVADRRPPSRKGLSGVGLQHRLRRGYLQLASEDPARWVVVDNELLLEDTVAQVTGLVEDALRDGAARSVESFHAARAASARTRPAPPAPRDADEALSAFLSWVDARAEREPRVAAYMLAGMWGPGVDARRVALVERVPEALLAGMTGLVDETSWALREALASSHPGDVARSLRGVPAGDHRATELRRGLEAAAPGEVCTSTTGLDDEASWELRDRHFAELPAEVVSSLAGLGSERAWELRDRWLAPRREALQTDYEVARTICRSIGGLDDERAWQLRDEAGAAKVAAVTSIYGLTSDRSWELRERHLARATKAVMSTLRRVNHPRSWPLRQAVASECKEAVDSIAGLDGPEAWALRDACLDVWPSTVVKSLGPLASVARGRQMVARQLGAYPGNISLLKHAAAISLGLRDLGSTED